MPLRLKKMLVSIGICLFLLVWIVVAVSVKTLLPPNRILEFVFYAVMGIGWIFPVMPMLRWIDSRR